MNAPARDEPQPMNVVDLSEQIHRAMSELVRAAPTAPDYDDLASTPPPARAGGRIALAVACGLTLAVMATIATRQGITPTALDVTGAVNSSTQPATVTPDSTEVPATSTGASAPTSQDLSAELPFAGDPFVALVQPLLPSGFTVLYRDDSGLSRDLVAVDARGGQLTVGLMLDGAETFHREMYSPEDYQLIPEGEIDRLERPNSATFLSRDNDAIGVSYRLSSSGNHVFELGLEPPILRDLVLAIYGGLNPDLRRVIAEIPRRTPSPAEALKPAVIAALSPDVTVVSGWRNETTDRFQIGSYAPPSLPGDRPSLSVSVDGYRTSASIPDEVVTLTDQVVVGFRHINGWQLIVTATADGPSTVDRTKIVALIDRVTVPFKNFAGDLSVQTAASQTADPPSTEISASINTGSHKQRNYYCRNTPSQKPVMVADLKIFRISTKHLRNWLEKTLPILEEGIWEANVKAIRVL